MTAGLTQGRRRSAKVPARTAFTGLVFGHEFGTALANRLGLDRWTGHRGWSAVAVVLFCWCPLVLFATIAQLAGSGGALGSLATDLKLHANFLVAAPLLVLTNIGAGRGLTETALQFEEAGIIGQSDAAEFRGILARAEARLTRPWIEAAILVLSYATLLPLVLSVDPANPRAWRHGEAGLSVAGWWHVLVSLPIFTALILGWFWRIIVWAALLMAVSKLDLRLLSPHPDRAAGLGFVGYSLRVLAPFGFAVGVIGAGTVADTIMRDGPLALASAVSAGSLTGAAFLLCLMPALTFMPRLVAERRRGVFGYDDLAHRLGIPFEKRWLGEAGRDRGILSEPDFSAATDLYQIVSNVHAMRFVPVDAGSVVVFITAALLPFVPALLLVVPAKQVLDGIRSLLF